MVFMVTLVFSIAGGAAIIAIAFLMPYLWRRIMAEDWPLKWYMAWRGPFLLRRPPPPPTPAGMTNKLNIKDYYRGHLTAEELAYVRASEMLLQSVQTSGNLPTFLNKDDDFALPPPAQSLHSSDSHERTNRGNEFAPPRPPGRWHSPRVILWKLTRLLLRGLEKDVVRLQKMNSIITWDIEDMHSRATRFDNRAEYTYASLQVLTAAAASFVHGANDVSNAIAPLSTAYEVWMSGEVPGEVPVPIWILCFGGAAIVLGLLTYGYHVMRNLGNRLTLISPSRGFCMELATAITVLIATRLELPVSVRLPSSFPSISILPLYSIFLPPLCHLCPLQPPLPSWGCPSSRTRADRARQRNASPARRSALASQTATGAASTRASSPLYTLAGSSRCPPRRSSRVYSWLLYSTRHRGPLGCRLSLPTFFCTCWVSRY